MEVKLQRDHRCRRFSGDNPLLLPLTYKEICFGTQVIADFVQNTSIPGIFVGDVGGCFNH